MSQPKEKWEIELDKKFEKYNRVWCCDEYGTGSDLDKLKRFIRTLLDQQRQEIQRIIAECEDEEGRHVSGKEVIRKLKELL